MTSPLTVDLFVEDRAHEAFLAPMLERVAREEAVEVELRVRSARGGHGRALTELALYQRLVRKEAAGATLPDVLVVGIDGNCSPFARARKAIEEATQEPFSGRLVAACPDPHVERWYLADPESFEAVVGTRPVLGERKCKRDYYKSRLAEAVRRAGHPSTLGGLEFAPEIVAGMDLYRATRNDRSFKAFLEDLRARLRRLGSGGGG